jgi:hypothetical protein
MSDPPRLLQTPSTEADLLEAWSSMRGPADGRAKALALAGLTVGAATAAGSWTSGVGGAGCRRSSSGVGSRPSWRDSSCEIRNSLRAVSNTCTGMRMVRD